MNPKTLLLRLFTFYKNLILENKKWLLASFLVFVSGAATGLIVSILFPYLGEEALKNYSSSIDQDISLGWELSMYVLERNLAIVTVASFFGAVFGVVPAFVTYVNGIVLGVVFGFVPFQGGVNLWQILLLIIPHGVFEYAGTLLSLSFGLRFGINWILAPAGKSRRAIFLSDFKKVLAIYPLVLVLLSIAALIEGLVTLEIACFLGNLCQN